MNKRIYKTAMYLRLSKGDDDLNTSDKTQSNSIESQKLIIGNYINSQDDLELSGCFIDDGHTGHNFDREAFKKMMKKIDACEIDCIVVKDNSRLGRDRIVTTEYISKTFEEKGVRFVSINDNYDSLTAGSSEKNLIMPITNLFNDNYSKDISNKVKASKQAKWNNGDFMGAFAPYGYKKDSNYKVTLEATNREMLLKLVLKINLFSQKEIDIEWKLDSDIIKVISEWCTKKH